MTKYRKIPVEVEAMLFNEETKNQVYSWAREIQMNITPDFDDKADPIDSYKPF